MIAVYALRSPSFNVWYLAFACAQVSHPPLCVVTSAHVRIPAAVILFVCSVYSQPLPVGPTRSRVPPVRAIPTRTLHGPASFGCQSFRLSCSNSGGPSSTSSLSMCPLPLSILMSERNLASNHASPIISSSSIHCRCLGHQSRTSPFPSHPSLVHVARMCAVTATFAGVSRSSPRIFSTSSMSTAVACWYACRWSSPPASRVPCICR